ncbi:MAG TPA: response regulator [Firmicutes bacterium]|nr:response regulator [Bacillota bacterium]
MGSTSGWSASGTSTRLPAGGASPWLLVAEDDPQSAALLRDMLAAAGYRCKVVADGDTTVQVGQSELPDLILLDLRIPGRNGFEVCELLKADPRTALIPIIVVTAFSEEHHRLRAIEAGADDFLTKPVRRAELYARIRSLLRLRNCMGEREPAGAVLESFLLMLEMRDPTLAQHCRAVSRLAALAASQAGLPAGDVDRLEKAGLVHDLGKIVGGGNPAEHPLRGERILKCLGPLSVLAPLVRSHHERWDGTGYPDGLPGQAQSPCVQLLAAANAWEPVLNSKGSPEEAAPQLQAEMQKGWWNPALFQPLLGAARQLYAAP